MIPIVTPHQMNIADASVETTTETLIRRAASAVAFEAKNLMGGTYGRRVLVVSGPGNNGADGAVAAKILRSWGALCEVVTPEKSVEATSGRDYHLVIDAAYGTGLRSAWNPGPQPSADVLAVDVPSGVNALTGDDLGSWKAITTVTFAALKPGLLLHPAASQVGRLKLAEIGPELTKAVTYAARAHLVADVDVEAWLEPRAASAHKWQSAVRVVAGSPAYQGAAHLTCSAALNAGAGMVVLSSPGCDPAAVKHPPEVVVRELKAGEGSSEPAWAAEVLADLKRFKLLVVGPGLGSPSGLSDETLSQTATLLEQCPLPVIVDADGLAVVAARPECVQRRQAATVLTPHEAEFDRLSAALDCPPLKPTPASGAEAAGSRSAQPDRLAAVAALANRLGAVVLLKGPTTLVASPAETQADQPDSVVNSEPWPGHILAVNSGSARLATAGSGDVLTGVMAGVIAAEQSTGIGTDQPAATAGASNNASTSQPSQLTRLVAAAAHWHGRTTAVPGHAQEVSTALPASQQVGLLSASRYLISCLAQNPQAFHTQAQLAQALRTLAQTQPNLAQSDLAATT